MIFWEFFTDPLLRAPFIASIIISIVTSMIGVTLFVQKRTLVAETLSHAIYPGVILGAMAAFALSSSLMTPFALIGGMVTAFLGMGFLGYMVRRLCVATDAALTFILATFFAFGILFSSYIQSVHPLFFQFIRNYIYGQAATLTDSDIVMYAFFLLIVVALLVSFYKELQLLFFDDILARLTLSSLPWISTLLVGLMTACIVMGMRSVGVILISGLLIAPALAARQYTHNLSFLFLLSALFGGLSALFGNLASFYLSLYYHLSLPTGPMIVMMAQFFAFASLLFAPHRGLVMRYLRICRFQWRCRQENLLKMLWHKQGDRSFDYKALRSDLGINRCIAYFLLLSCRNRGWIQGISLTEEGEKKGRQIVRVHRLWELYLVEDLRMKKEEVHKSAEEMEHILTPDLALKLTSHLSNPLFDPHNQPIPHGGPHG